MQLQNIPNTYHVTNALGGIPSQKTIYLACTEMPLWHPKKQVSIYVGKGKQPSTFWNAKVITFYVWIWENDLMHTLFREMYQKSIYKYVFFACF